jgi:acyl dehydratase
VTALADIAGVTLGERTAAFGPRDAILYALAVGAPPDRLDLVYERDLRVLPTLAAALGLWAVEAAGELGAYDRRNSLHAAQRLEIRRPLRPHDHLTMRGRIGNVWDKGRAAVVEVEVDADAFAATYTIFLPGLGGWGGERGPSSRGPELAPAWHAGYLTAPGQAALYRLTGDLHPVHIDPAVAGANGFDRPILHGLCTLGIAARIVADAVGAHPADLLELDARLTAPVLPGDALDLVAQPQERGEVRFEARSGAATAISGGRARFAPSDARD